VKGKKEREGKKKRETSEIRGEGEGGRK